jgi:hypothetical protein
MNENNGVPPEPDTDDDLRDDEVAAVKESQNAPDTAAPDDSEVG